METAPNVLPEWIQREKEDSSKEWNMCWNMIKYFGRFQNKKNDIKACHTRKEVDSKYKHFSCQKTNDFSF